jgi:predicted protein tyrosine phosphatase
MPPVFEINSNQKVAVASRRVIETPFCADEYFVLISAREKNSAVPSIKSKHFRDGLFLTFDDIDGPCGDYIPMSQDQAEQIVNFVLRNRDFPLIVCQCDGGVSRSGAMAAAIVWFLKGDDSEVWNNRFLYPNRHVYRLLVNEFVKRGCPHMPDFTKKSPPLDPDEDLF